MKDAIVPLDSEDRVNVVIIDDSMFERNRFRKIYDAFLGEPRSKRPTFHGRTLFILF